MSTILWKDFRNEVELIGKVGREPEFGVFEGGRRYAEFTVISSFSYYNNNGELVEQMLRQHVVFWQKNLMGAIQRKVTKGTSISIRGSLVPRSFVDAAGAKQFRTQIVGKRFKILQETVNKE